MPVFCAFFSHVTSANAISGIAQRDRRYLATTRL
jgi:hypothetical protein